MSQPFRPLLDSTDKFSQIIKNTIGIHKKNYFDYTASGLAYQPIEDRIRDILNLCEYALKRGFYGGKNR